VVVVVEVIVELFGATLGEGAAFEVEACTTRRELSFLPEGPVGSGATGGFVRVSATGAFWADSTGLELGAGEGELVCAFARVKVANTAAPAQMTVLKRLAIDVM
jgi:hypothetical protein